MHKFAFWTLFGFMFLVVEICSWAASADEFGPATYCRTQDEILQLHALIQVDKGSAADLAKMWMTDGECFNLHEIFEGYVVWKGTPAKYPDGKWYMPIGISPSEGGKALRYGALPTGEKGL